MDENNPHHVHPYCFRCHRTFLNVNVSVISYVYTIFSTDSIQHWITWLLFIMYVLSFLQNRTQCSRCGGALYLTSHLLIQENPLSHLSDLLSIFGIGRVIPGLSEQQISRIPKVRVTAEEQHDNLGCVICLINFAERENVSKLNCNVSTFCRPNNTYIIRVYYIHARVIRVASNGTVMIASLTVWILLYSQHMFHVRCISEWLKTHKTCPNCRADVKPTRQNLMMSMHNLSHDDDDVDPVLVFVERENTAVRAAEVGAAIAPAEPPIQLVQGRRNRILCLWLKEEWNHKNCSYFCRSCWTWCRSRSACPNALYKCGTRKCDSVRTRWWSRRFASRIAYTSSVAR